MSNKRKPKPKSNGRAQGIKAPSRGKTYGKGSRNERREEEIADTSAAMSRSNPISFYTKFAQFAEDAARIPFSKPLGAVSTILMGDGGTHKVATPGVMALMFAPTVGVSSDFTSPLNRSSINYYARIRSTQKAFGDYDHQDLTMMMLAIDSAIMFHALGRRIYGVLTDMTPVNRYYPRALVAANGVSFPASQKQIQDFRAFLNEFALQIEQYALPRNINLFERHSWMCEGLYVDSESTRAQTYMFVPTGFWQYNDQVTTGSELKWVEYFSPNINTPTQLTIDQFMDFGRGLINAMSNNADFATIAGDLYAYYGGDVMKLPYIDEHYTILPKYDKTVLSQIENAVIAGKWAPGYTPVISQNPSVNAGAIIFEPVVECYNAAPVMTPMINMHVESPTSDEVMEATRLMSTYGQKTEGTSFTIATCGSELLQYVNVYSVNPATNAIRFNQLAHNHMTLVEPADSNATINLLSDILNLAVFDWAPQLRISFHTTASGWKYLGSTWDVDNMTEIKEEYLDYINTAALYSLFNVESR